MKEEIRKVIEKLRELEEKAIATTRPCYHLGMAIDSLHQAIESIKEKEAIKDEFNI